MIIHLSTIATIAIAATVHWGKTGSSQLIENWNLAQPGSANAIAKQIFYGVCIGFLGNTGFELAPNYIEEVEPTAFPSVLRNLWLMSLIPLPYMMLLVWAVVPYAQIQSNSANIVSILAEQAVGAKWLRYWLVADAVLVLCAGVFTGIISSCGSLEQLARDLILPSFFLRRMKVTEAPYVSITFFTVICLALFGVSGTNLTILDGQYAIAFLLVMGLFALSNLLLKFNRDRLVRKDRVGLPLVFFALAVVVIAIAGNIALSPVIAGYFALFFLIALTAMSYTSFRGKLLIVIYWFYNRNKRLHSWKWTRNWHLKLVAKIKNLKRQPVIFFAKTDQISVLNDAIRYINKNEYTGTLSSSFWLI